MFGSCLVMQYLVSFLFLQSPRRERESLAPYCCHVDVSILCLFHTVPWVGVQCVIMAFPGRTNFFNVQRVYIFNILSILLNLLGNLSCFCCRQTSFSNSTSFFKNKLPPLLVFTNTYFPPEAT